MSWKGQLQTKCLLIQWLCLVVVDSVYSVTASYQRVADEAEVEVVALLAALIAAEVILVIAASATDHMDIINKNDSMNLAASG